MSAPARAWLTAVRASSSSVASLSTLSVASRSTPQWPWSVYSHRHTSVITSSSRQRRLIARDGELHDALLVPGARALARPSRRAPRTASPPRSRAPPPSRPPRPPRRATAARRRASRAIGSRRIAARHEQRQHERAGAQLASRAPARAARRCAQPAHARLGKAIALQVSQSSQRAAEPEAGRARRTATRQRRAGARPRRRCAGDGAVDGRVERLQRGLEGKHERDRADHVVQPARRPRPLGRARGTPAAATAGTPAATRRAPRARARRSRCRAPRTRARRTRARPATARRAPSRAPRRRRPRQHRERHHERAPRRQQRLLRQQRLPRDQPADQPRERVLFALQRDAAGGEQHADEHQRDAHRDDHREGVQRRAPAVDERALDRDRLADGREHVLAEPEVVRREFGERGDPFERRAVAGPAACARSTSRSRRGIARGRSGSTAPPSTPRLSAREQQVESPPPRLAGSASESARFACASAELHAASARATASARRRCRALRPAPGSRPGGDFGPRCPAGSRPPRAPRPMRRRRSACGARWDADGVDLAEQLVGVFARLRRAGRRRGSSRRAASRRRSPPAACDGPARDREPDQQRDRDRVDDSSATSSRERAQDQQVLAQQPPHCEVSAACALEERDETRARSRPRRLPSRAPASLAGVPSNSSPPSVEHEQRGRHSAAPRPTLWVENSTPRARRREPADELPQPLALAGVERRGRLVQQQHGRVGEQPERDVHALAVAARETSERSPARSASPVCSSIRATAASRLGDPSRRANSRRFSATDSFE